MHSDIKEILFSEKQIADRVAEMGWHITRAFEPCVECGEQIVLACILRGAAVFMADLARAIHLPLFMDFMTVSSYGDAARSSGTVEIVQDLKTDIVGKRVIIAEDILDTGLTLSRVISMLSERGALSVDVVAMLRKDVAEQEPIVCFDTGFVCPNEFIVGYGLDYAERYRNLPYIGVLKPEVYS